MVRSAVLLHKVHRLHIPRRKYHLTALIQKRGQHSQQLIPRTARILHLRSVVVALRDLQVGMLGIDNHLHAEG